MCAVLSRSVVSDSLQPSRLLCPWNSPGKKTRVGCHFLLQGIFPTQGSKPGLTHCRQILYQLSHQGSPYIPLFPLFSSVQSFNCVQLFVTPWTVARQASLSLTNSWNLLKLMSSNSVMPFNHLILCCLLLLLPSIFLSIRIFSSESVLPIRWPKDWSFSFIMCPSNEYSGLISFRMDWLELLAV